MSAMEARPLARGRRGPPPGRQTRPMAFWICAADLARAHAEREFLLKRLQTQAACRLNRGSPHRGR